MFLVNLGSSSADQFYFVRERDEVGRGIGREGEERKEDEEGRRRADNGQRTVVGYAELLNE